MLHLVGEPATTETATRFDGPSGILAHCFYPPPGGGSTSRVTAHFDEAETWSVNTPPSAASTCRRSRSTNSGHGLGLAHSNVTSQLSCTPTTVVPRRELTDGRHLGASSRSTAPEAALGLPRRQPSSTRVVANNADGRLEVFATRRRRRRSGTSGRPRPTTAGAAGQSLGGGIQGPHRGGRERGRPAGGVRHAAPTAPSGTCWQTAPNNGWSGWASLGGGDRRPGASPGTPMAGWRSSSRAPTAPSGTSGRPRPATAGAAGHSLGGWHGQPGGVAKNADGRLEIFVARHRRRALAHVADRTQQRLERLGIARRRDPEAAGRRHGTRTAGSRSSRGGRTAPLWHIWQTAPNNGWSGWASLGGGIVRRRRRSTTPTVASRSSRRGADNGPLAHLADVAPNNGWSGWCIARGRLTEGPIASRNADGRLGDLREGPRRRPVAHVAERAEQRLDVIGSRHPGYTVRTCESRAPTT